MLHKESNSTFHKILHLSFLSIIIPSSKEPTLYSHFKIPPNELYSFLFLTQQKINIETTK